MLAIQRLGALRRLPPVVVLGVALMVAGGVMDVVAHVAPVAYHAHESARGEHTAHLVGIAGMVLVLAGVVVHGARRHARRSARTNGGLDTHADR